MPFGSLIKDNNNVPISQGYTPGVGFVGVQTSSTIVTDGGNNSSAALVFSDSIQELIARGQIFTAAFQTTIGSSAQGYYSMSVFNPSSSKNILLYFVRGWVSSGTSVVYLFKNTTNPSLANTYTPINNRFGGPASILTTSVTYNTASGGISFPSSTLMESDNAPAPTAVSVLEFGNYIIMPAGSAFGCQVVIYVGNSLQYGLTMSWGEI